MLRSVHWAASEQLVPVKVVHLGIQLVFEDAVWGSSRCEADREHTPTSNIQPHEVGVLDGRLGSGPAGPSGRSSFALSAHCRCLRKLMGTLGQPRLQGLIAHA
jgi:hypothetical protein